MYALVRHIPSPAEQCLKDSETHLESIRIAKESISNIDNCLKESISDIDTCLKESISDIDTCLKESISDIDTCLKESISDIDTCLKESISVVDTCLKESISDIDTCFTDHRTVMGKVVRQEEFTTKQDCVDHCLDHEAYVN